MTVLFKLSDTRGLKLRVRNNSVLLEFWIPGPRLPRSTGRQQPGSPAQFPLRRAPPSALINKPCRGGSVRTICSTELLVRPARVVLHSAGQPHSLAVSLLPILPICMFPHTEISRQYKLVPSQSKKALRLSGSNAPLLFFFSAPQLRPDACVTARPLNARARPRKKRNKINCECTQRVALLKALERRRTRIPAKSVSEHSLLEFSRVSRLLLELLGK